MNVVVLVEVLAGLGAWIWLLAEVLEWLGDRRTSRHRVPRPDRAAVEDPAVEPTADLTPYVCLYCHRNAGHDAGCYAARVQRRTDEIQIPREGTGETL